MADVLPDTMTGGVLSFAGRAADVSGQLNGLKNDRVVVIAVDDLSQSEADALENLLLGAAKLFRQMTADQLAEQMAFLVKAFSPKAPPSPVMIKEAEMTARASGGVRVGRLAHRLASGHAGRI